MANTIIRKDYVHNRDEAVAAGTITPGDLVETVADGTVQRHSVAGGHGGSKTFAVENELLGKSITDNYVADDLVYLWKPIPGDRVYVQLDSGSPAVTREDTLQSAGNGKLTKSDLGSQSAGQLEGSIIARPTEPADPGDWFTVEIV